MAREGVLDHAPFAVNPLQCDQAGKELDMIQPFCRRLARQLAIFSQNGWQSQGFEAVVQKYLRGLGHAACPRMRAM